MDAELRQVANGFDYKVRSFDKYDINGYRFRTYGKELSMADRKSTNCCVSAIGEGGTEYYGRVEAIYELLFYGENPPNVVVFKCYWFQPKETRRTHEHIGLVEINQSTHLDVPDVYITAQQATQVFYLPWACQTNPNLKGWDVVYEVPPRARLSPPKEEDYEPHINPDDVYITAQQATQVLYLPWACQTNPNLKGWDVVYEVPPRARLSPPKEEDYEPHINPDTYEGEFFQETRLSKKRFKNRYTSPQNIEVDSDNESDITPEEEQEEPEQEEVTAADDLSLLDRLRQGGLPHVDATEPYEPVIDYSDDDDYAFIDDTDRDY